MDVALSVRTKAVNLESSLREARLSVVAELRGIDTETVVVYATPFDEGNINILKSLAYSSEIFAIFIKNSIILEYTKFLENSEVDCMGYTVAVVGATGAVGAQMIKMLEESSLPIDKIRYLASARSAGKVLQFKGQDVTIEETTETAFEGVDIALFSAGGSTSAKYAPYAVKAGAVVVDNTSYFRQHADVPLVVPEVNAHALDQHKGIIACPNCSTIQMMVALEPIRQQWGLERIIVSTYQAVSGAGMGAILETQRELREVLNDGVNPRDLQAEILPSGGDKKHYPIAFNALPQIDLFTDNDYTYEEMKMTKETKKIMEDESIAVSATCVRIPVLSAHSESVYIETKEVAPIEEVKAAIAAFPGAVLEDDVAHQVYPQAINAVGSRDTFVGRIRKDLDAEKGIHMWVVSDNLLKGAAWNSVQIAETLHERGLVRPTEEVVFELK